MMAIMRDAHGGGAGGHAGGNPAPAARLPGRQRRRADGAGQPEVEWVSDEVGRRRGGLPQPAARLAGRRAPAARPGPRRRRRGRAGARSRPPGLEARVLQHEIDHLDGVLILDRAPRAQRKAALRALREGGSYSPCADEESERRSQREHREPAHRRVRTAYLGTSEFAAAVLRRLADSAHRPRSSSRRPTGRAAAAAGTQPPPAAEAARELGSSCFRPMTSTTTPARAHPRRARPRRPSSARSVS